MRITETRSGAVTVLRPAGPLVGEDAGVFLGSFRDAVTRSMGRVALDCSMVSHLDSLGLEALVDASETLSDAGQAMRLFGVNETIREVFELTGRAGLFECFADVNAATRSFL